MEYMLDEEEVKMATITRSKSRKTITVDNTSDTENLSMSRSINSISGTTNAGGRIIIRRKYLKKNGMACLHCARFLEREKLE